MSAVTERQQLSYIAGQAADARINVELETEGMTLNLAGGQAMPLGQVYQIIG